MNIEELHAAKRNLEVHVAALLEQFESDTGCRVEGFHFKRFTRFSGTTKYIGHADVRI